MSDAAVLFIIGGCFILLGTGFFFWGRKEQRDYEEGLAGRYDLREFVEHTPERPEPGALKTGGVIGAVIGIVLLVIGFILL